LSDSYQATYDAVRSKLTGCNMHEAVSDAIRNAFDGHAASMAIQACAQDVAYAQTRPSVLMRPELVFHRKWSRPEDWVDGQLTEAKSAWVARYSNVAGVGDTPEKAMLDFDAEWCKSQPG